MQFLALPVSRRLLKLANVFDINLDPEILTLADQKYSIPTGLTEIDQSAIQSLIDYDFRAIFPGYSGTKARIIFTAAEIMGINDIFVISKEVNPWRNYKNIIRLNDDLNEPELLKSKRDGILIFDGGYRWTPSNMTPMDFPRTIWLTNKNNFSTLDSPGYGEVVSQLFPNQPYALLQASQFLKMTYKGMGFKTTEFKDIAFLYNILTEYVND